MHLIDHWNVNAKEFWRELVPEASHGTPTCQKLKQWAPVLGPILELFLKI